MIDKDEQKAVKAYSKILLLQDDLEIAQHIVGFCLYSNNYRLSIKLLNYFINHTQICIRSAVVHGIGYIAMNHHKIDKDLIEKIFNIDKQSNYQDLEDALDDLETFIKDERILEHLRIYKHLNQIK